MLQSKKCLSHQISGKSLQAVPFQQFPPICTQIHLNCCCAEITGAAAHVSGSGGTDPQVPGAEGVAREKKMIHSAKLPKRE